MAAAGPLCGGAAVLLIVLFRSPIVGKLLRALFSFAMLALCLILLFQHAPFDPTLSQFSRKLGLDGQQVVGDEVRIRMGRDGHFWAKAHINGLERRMLIDSGATITGLSKSTAEEASLQGSNSLVPVVLQTANGAVRATTGTVSRLVLGSIEARNLKVVTSPGLGTVDILGMNFLSQLECWRVEGRTLILKPHAPSPD